MRLAYLRRKFYEALRAGRKIITISRAEPRKHPIPLPFADEPNVWEEKPERLRFAEVLPLFLRLNEYGTNTLLYLTRCSHNRRSGTVELLAPGVMRGYVDDFVIVPELDNKDHAAWLRVAVNAWLLDKGPNASFRKTRRIMTFPTTISSIARQRFVRTPPRSARRGRCRCRSRGLRALAERTGAALNAVGVGRGDRVAIVLANGPEAASAFLSVACYAVTAPLNPSYRTEEFAFYLSDLKARALIVQQGRTRRHGRWRRSRGSRSSNWSRIRRPPGPSSSSRRRA